MPTTMRRDESSLVKRCNRSHEHALLSPVALGRKIPSRSLLFATGERKTFCRCKCVRDQSLIKSSKSIASLIGGYTSLAEQYEALCKAYFRRQVTPVTIFCTPQDHFSVYLDTAHGAVG